MRSRELTIGILAHVDAGKTTLSEGLLYLSGAIRRAGRVDHGDAFLDTYAVEKARGITVFSKPARFMAGDFEITLLDTPGHADFSPEMERVLSVLDYAVLLVSAAEGVNARVRVLWRLLAHYRIPAFVFVNKMDQSGASRDAVLGDLRGLGEGVVDWTDGLESAAVQEEIAVLDERLTEQYLAGERISRGEAAGLIDGRRLFPVLFGSALRMSGVEELLETLKTFLRARDYPERFAARVFKITRDGGERLVWLKLVGGKLAVRDGVAYPPAAGNAGDDAEEERVKEKITGIRRYSGTRMESVSEVQAGAVCAVTGLSRASIGQGLGEAADAGERLLMPVLRRKVLLPEGVDAHHAWELLKTIEEEEPMLRLSYEEQTGEIFLGIMGEVQTEILAGQIAARLGFSVSFGDGSVIYRETIRRPVEGVGHFEPLRHYAEVHVRLSPLPPGSGVVVDADCRTEMLAGSFQRLAVSNLQTKRHKGVLTGSDLTDVRITLIGGRAHEKHTEGGDFRKAAIRAVRQGLMTAENILLEPVYHFSLELPRESLGLALTDLEKMAATPEAPDIAGDLARLSGICPVATWGDYALRVRAYTGGRGSAAATPAGYRPCHNAREVFEACAYDPEADLRNPVSSVFCAHGAGERVPWYEVRGRMHVDTGWRADAEEEIPYPQVQGIRLAPGGASPDGAEASPGETGRARTPAQIAAREKRAQSAEEELLAIFARTYGRIRRPGEQEESAPKKRVYEAPKPKYRAPKAPPEKKYLLIDGYNMIHANRELKALAETDIHAAREALIEAVANVQGFSDETMLLVFDAYKVPGGRQEVLAVHGLTVIYTKEAETADQYIEKAAREIGKKYRVRVATSDGIEQIIIFGAGALRLSAAGFWEELTLLNRRIGEAIGNV